MSGSDNRDGHAHTGCGSKEANKRTSVLNAMFRKDTVTPVTHAANGLDTACPMRWWWIWGFDAVTAIKVETLPKPSAHPVPLFTVRMFYDDVNGRFGGEVGGIRTSNSLSGSKLDVVGERKPIELPVIGVNEMIRLRLSLRTHHHGTKKG